MVFFTIFNDHNRTTGAAWWITLDKSCHLTPRLWQRLCLKASCRQLCGASDWIRACEGEVAGKQYKLKKACVKLVPLVDWWRCWHGHGRPELVIPLSRNTGSDAGDCRDWVTSLCCSSVTRRWPDFMFRLIPALIHTSDCAFCIFLTVCVAGRSPSLYFNKVSFNRCDVRFNSEL